MATPDGASSDPYGRQLSAPGVAFWYPFPIFYLGGEFPMKTVRQMLSVLSIVLGLVWMAAPAVGQTCAWSGLGIGMDRPVSALTAFVEPSDVHALAVFADGSGPALYAGGFFTQAGGVAANHIARWDGTQWSPLGSGMQGVGSSFTAVLALTVFDDGRGPALYAGGRFATAGGVEVNGIARWDGTQWSALGGGVTGGASAAVYALTVFDDGRGPAPYAGGNFTIAGGLEINRIARWDGAQWSAVGGGMGPNNTSVSALTLFNDGSGLALYAGGSFTIAGGVPANHIARWNGTQWSPLGSGINGGINSLT